MAVLPRKVDQMLCNKMHQIMEKRLDEVAENVKEMTQAAVKTSLAIENLRGMVQREIDLEANRWDRVDDDRTKRGK